jgi:hypothetical protein
MAHGAEGSCILIHNLLITTSMGGAQQKAEKGRHHGWRCGLSTNSEHGGSVADPVGSRSGRLGPDLDLVLDPDPRLLKLTYF